MNEETDWDPYIQPIKYDTKITERNHHPTKGPFFVEHCALEAVPLREASSAKRACSQVPKKGDPVPMDDNQEILPKID